MKKLFWTLSIVFLAIVLTSCQFSKHNNSKVLEGDNYKTTAKIKPDSGGLDKIIKTEAEWKQLLSPEQYRILRQKRDRALLQWQVLGQ